MRFSKAWQVLEVGMPIFSRFMKRKSQQFKARKEIITKFESQALHAEQENQLVKRGWNVITVHFEPDCLRP